jgi:hypothetical protein
MCLEWHTWLKNYALLKWQVWLENHAQARGKPRSSGTQSGMSQASARRAASLGAAPRRAVSGKAGA